MCYNSKTIKLISANDTPFERELKIGSNWEKLKELKKLTNNAFKIFKISPYITILEHFKVSVTNIENICKLTINNGTLKCPRIVI